MHIDIHTIARPTDILLEFRQVFLSLHMQVKRDPADAVHAVQYNSK